MASRFTSAIAGGRLTFFNLSNFSVSSSKRACDMYGSGLTSAYLPGLRRGICIVVVYHMMKFTFNQVLNNSKLFFVENFYFLAIIVIIIFFSLVISFVDYLYYIVA